MMKLMCKCGNIEDIKTDINVEKFIFRSSEGGILVMACKKCNEEVSIVLKNN
ncbi:hypothetical protein K9O30_06245 [Clostridium bowmanii]|uniref:hypothetical protein n=1 Tax=Clostridium bowmanii TaxID=132925 RepID=UPI001C0A9F3E|nr:hypothetical protein [Clostridium bowmanii]MBU3188760.1 hypothetical protein [Clostridium bowmanii]MCA1073345.1 hypothetical protein [Clostridium bowmanii]